MAVNFGLLQPAQPASAFFQGQQDVQREAEQNMLRQSQAEQRQFERENMLAQRQERNLLAQQRGAQDARAAQTAEIEREIKTVDLASKLLYGATPETYPSIRDRLSGLNPRFGASLPPEYNEAQVKALAMQGRSVKEQIEAALGRERYMSTPYGPFDVEARQYVMPPTLPARAPAAGTAAPAPAAPKAPVGYRFTGSGNLEAIPGGPATRGPAARGGAAPAAPSAKPPTAAQVAKTEAQVQARAALSKDLQTVLGYYTKLNDMGAMPSSETPISENILASARSTAAGQEVERFTATKAQTQRDNISNSRQRLLSHIKNATGASAQQMNSNVELQTWMNALTNPRQSIETVRETLGQLDAVIASVESDVERERKRAGASTATPTPSPASDLAAERENARSAIAAGAPEAAVRKRFKEKTGQEL
jgi:hypothetical protein